MEVLKQAEIDRFVNDGYVRLNNAFSPETAAAAAAAIFELADVDPGDAGWHIDSSFGEAPTKTGSCLCRNLAASH